jgi:hypothetical protein
MDEWRETNAHALANSNNPCQDLTEPDLADDFAPEANSALIRRKKKLHNNFTESLLACARESRERMLYLR